MQGFGRRPRCGLRWFRYRCRRSGRRCLRPAPQRRRLPIPTTPSQAVPRRRSRLPACAAGRPCTRPDCAKGYAGEYAGRAARKGESLRCVRCRTGHSRKQDAGARRGLQRAARAAWRYPRRVPREGLLRNPFCLALFCLALSGQVFPRLRSKREERRRRGGPSQSLVGRSYPCRTPSKSAASGSG